jgi:CRISPR-associated endonuclease Csy4
MPHLSHHLTLRLLPDPEFPAQQLFSALYAKLHRALCDLQAEQATTAIGVSFPQHSLHPLSLGPVLRLHGSEADLGTLMARPWLTGMRDHLASLPRSPEPVPPSCQSHRVVRRVQPEASPARQLRRQLRRHPESPPDVLAIRRPDGNVPQALRLPHIHLRSRSTGHPYPLYIEHGPLQPSSATGGYNRYGLSQDGATVPWF